MLFSSAHRRRLPAESYAVLVGTRQITLPESIGNAPFLHNVTSGWSPARAVRRRVILGRQAQKKVMGTNDDQRRPQRRRGFSAISAGSASVVVFRLCRRDGGRRTTRRRGQHRGILGRASSPGADRSGRHAGLQPNGELRLTDDTSLASSRRHRRTASRFAAILDIGRMTTLRLAPHDLRDLSHHPTRGQGLAK
jgi:hypothetical protein